jgi:hypothetical protein
MRGIEIGLNEVTPTIPSEKKIQVVGLKFPFRFLRKEISHKDDLIETDQGLTCCERTPPEKAGVCLPRSYRGILNGARMHKDIHKHTIP